MEPNKKYILTDITKEFISSSKTHILHRIKALKDFADVKAGDLGGWIESEQNLDIQGNCWVYDDACVCDRAIVIDNGTVSDNAHVMDRAMVSGDAIVMGQSVIRDAAYIGGTARIFGAVTLSGCSIVRGDAVLDGNIYIDNSVRFSHTPKRYIVIGPIGSRLDTTTFYTTKDGQIYVETGCFVGSIEVFEQRVRKVYGGHYSGIFEEYTAAIETARRVLKIKERNKRSLAAFRPNITNP